MYRKSTLLGLLLFCFVFANAQKKINFDEGWKFHFGNSANPEKDFNYGSTLLFHKSNVYETTIVSLKFVDTTWTNVAIPHDWVVELPFVKSATHEMDSHGYNPPTGL